MDANELIEEFLTEHIDIVIAHSSPQWRFYIDPFTGKQVWYNEEAMWDKFGGYDEQSMYSKPPFEPDNIP